MAETSKTRMVIEWKQRLQSLKNERATYDPMFRDIRDYFSPRSARFNTGDPVERQGTRTDQNIINTTPRIAVRTLPAGLQSGLTSPTRPWFLFGTEDPGLMKRKDVSVWVDDTRNRVLNQLLRSNMYDVFQLTYNSLGLFGNGAQFIDDDPETVFRGHNLLFGTYFIDVDASGRPDTLYREIRLTTKQMIERFGKDKVRPEVITQFNLGQYQQLWEVIHLVEPNRGFIDGSDRSVEKRFMSVWLDQSLGDERAILKMSGFRDKPFQAPRWNIIGMNPWGEGPGEIALGDGKQLQLMEKRKLQGIEKNVNPPMIADSSLRNARTSVLPGATTYVNGLVNGQAGFKPTYQINPALSEIRLEIEASEDRINEAFYKNLFQIILDIGDTQGITATQINAIREEKLLNVSPVLERLNGEMLDPTIERTFNQMFRAGKIAPPPSVLQGQKLKIEYISILAQAQKAQGISNIERLMDFTLGVAERIPGALDKIDGDELIEQYADGVGVAPSIIRGDEEVDIIRQNRVEEENARAAAEGGEAFANIAKTLSETDTGSESALTQVNQGGQ